MFLHHILKSKLFILIYTFVAGIYLGHCTKVIWDKYLSLYYNNYSISSPSPFPNNKSLIGPNYFINKNHSEANERIYKPIIHLDVSVDDSDNSTSPYYWPQIEKTAAKETHRRRLFVITPTVKNPIQIADLTRLAQALYPVRYFVIWFIFEDADQSRKKYPNHLHFIRRHLLEFIQDPDFMIHIRWSRSREKKLERLVGNPRGVEARRDGMDVVRTEYPFQDGVVFFADDDDTYEPRLFLEMLSTKKASAWPIGLVTPGTALSTPVVNASGIVINFHDGYIVNRRFPVSFSGIAVNKQLIMNPEVNIPYMEGYEETVYMSSLGIKVSDLEPLGNGATEVLAYHLKTLVDRTRQYPASKITSVASSLQRTNIEDLFTMYEDTSHLSLRRKASPKPRSPNMTFQQVIHKSNTSIAKNRIQVTKSIPRKKNTNPNPKR